ncbi:hypothetical protein [Streptomyces sp. NPDC053048]|uniref:effector-associated constant component EACC1 n=1 Tax=Streptomyces sp. NPDC053048 TaxID=3365694 RepID=UPI0037D6E48B
MDIRITVESGQGEADLRSLEEWLLRSRGLRRTPITRPAPVIRPDDMGAVSDILMVSLGAGGAGAVLANAVSVWLQNRVTHVKVRIESPRGSVDVEAGNIRNPAALIMRILEEGPDIDSGPPPDGDDDGTAPMGRTP